MPLLLGRQALSLRNFKKPSGDLLGVAFDENHIIVEWCANGKVVFSMERRGNALCCHFSSDKKGLRHIKQAINDFVELVRDKFDWCKMLIAIINKPSVERVVKKVDFCHIGFVGESKIYVRNVWVA